MDEEEKKMLFNEISILKELVSIALLFPFSILFIYMHFMRIFSYIYEQQIYLILGPSKYCKNV